MSAEIVLDLAARRNAKQNDQLIDEIFELLTRCGVTWTVPRDHPDVLLIRDLLAQAKRVIRAAQIMPFEARTRLPVTGS